MGQVMENGNYVKLIIGLGTARIKMLPVEVVKNIQLGELTVQRQMGMDLAVRLAKRSGVEVSAEFGALVGVLAARPDLYEECQDLLSQLEKNELTIFI
jgi:hypothetical protein